MLELTEIESRLREMRENSDPGLLWDESCRGSARALVLFVGPSPGGKKATERRPRIPNCRPALWNECFDMPLKFSAGFRASFSPLVESIFAAPYATAGKLIGLGNLDWLGNPESQDVQERHMREGAPSVLKMIEGCKPELVLPMDKKTFRVLKSVMTESGFALEDVAVERFEVRMSNAFDDRRHRSIHGFKARSPGGQSCAVIKLPQHPARMFQPEYGARCGTAVRIAARQIDSGLPVDATAN
jgi:hypothetical protein